MIMRSKKKPFLLIFALIIGINNPIHSTEITLKGIAETLTSLGTIITYVAYAAISLYAIKTISDDATTKPTPVQPATRKIVTFKDYIGVPEEATTLVDVLKNPTKYEKMGVEVPHGLLLTGDPGTGKTYLAQAIAGEVDCPFFEYAATDFAAKYVGESEGNVRKMFTKARAAAQKAEKKIAIIFIDELDAIGTRGSEGSATSNINLTHTFLTEMDGFAKSPIHIIVIGATNFPEKLDTALRRPGRFDLTINIPYPSIEARNKILALTAKDKPISPNITFNNLANATEGMSQADIKLLFDLAGTIALKENRISRNYDSFARAIWQIKEQNYMLKIAPRESRKTLINRYLQSFQIKGLLIENLLGQTTDMTNTDIEEVFQKAYQFARQNSEKTLIEWLQIAIEAKKQQLKIRKNKDAFELCIKLYNPIHRSAYTHKELLTLDPNDIFNEFVKLERDNLTEEKRLEEEKNEQEYVEAIQESKKNKKRAMELKAQEEALDLKDKLKATWSIFKPSTWFQSSKPEKNKQLR